MKLALLFSAGFVLASLTSAQTQTGGVRGTIVDAVTRQPVRKATVSVQFVALPNQISAQKTPSVPGQPSVPPTAPGMRTIAPLAAKPQSVITDASGTFLFDQLQPAMYRLTIFHQGYPQNRFGPAPAGKTFTVTAGEIAGPLTVELVPGASVSGHIVDEDGDPLTGCNTQLHPARYPEQNVIGMPGQQAAGSETGEYRLYGIPPGKYLLRVQCQTPVFQPRPLSSGPNPPASLGYPAQFYPAAGSAESAEILDLAPGMERSGLDFRMKPVAMTRVQVSLTGAGWQGRKDLSWRVVPAGHSAVFGYAAGRDLDTSKETFDIPNIFPGSYKLIVAPNPFTRGPEATRTPEGTAMIAGILDFEVPDLEAKDKPVRITVEMRSAADISGFVQIENPGAAVNLSLRQISVQLVPQDGVTGRQGGMSSVQEDGSFVIKSPMPIPSRLQVNAPSAFLKSAWFGNAEVTDGLIDPASGGQLRLLVSTNMAAIHGTAPAGAQIVATLVSNSPPAFSRGAQADPSGQFRLDGLAPGKYRVAALDGGNALSGPLTEEGGQEITLKEGETRTLELKAETARR